MTAILIAVLILFGVFVFLNKSGGSSSSHSSSKHIFGESSGCNGDQCSLR